jgi:F-type H+-transporting ATPase subunit delta
VIRQSIARRYAKGLFAVGERDGKQGEYLRQMRDVLSVLEAGPRLATALTLPLLEMEKRKELLSDVAKALDASPSVSAFLALLLEKNRINYLPLICEAFAGMVDEKAGVVKGVGYAPYPVSGDVRAKIEEALARRLARKVELDMRQDASLIGGIKVVVGGYRIDGSVKRQFELLNERMLKE